MKNIFLILLMTFTLQVFAQQSVSIIGAGSASQDDTRCFYHDQHGNFYVYMDINNPGLFHVFGDTIINPYTNSSVNVLAKFDPQLNLLWAQCYKYSNYSTVTTQKIAVDDDGNIYISDTKNGNVQIGPFILTNGAGNITFKTDSMGNPIWLKTFSGENITYRDHHLELVAVTSMTDSINGQYISNPKGTVVWLDTAGNYLTHFVVDDVNYEIEHLYGRMNNGNYYGVRIPINTFANQPVEMFIVDSTGNFVYNKIINYTQGITPTLDLKYDSQNNEFVYFGFLGDEHPLDSFETSSPWARLKIIKLDSWFYLKHQIDLSTPGTLIQTSGMGVIEVQDGEVFFAGELVTLRWSNVGYLHPHNGLEDQIIYGKLDKNLEYRWHRVWPQLYYVQSIGGMVALGKDLYIAGGTVSFSYDSVNFIADDMDAFLFHAIDLDSVHAEISGTAFVDVNMNGIRDNNEAGNPFHAVNNSASSAYGVSDPNGNFELTAHLGQNIIRSTTLPRYWANSTPDSISVLISSDDTIVGGLEFGIYPIPDLFELQIDMQNISGFRPGFTTPTMITYKNDGTDSISGNITVYLDSVLSYSSSPQVPDSWNNDSIVWSFTNLLPGEVRQIYVEFMTDLNTWGLPVHLNVRIDPVEGDTLPLNNFDYISSVIVSSIDPNDKQVNPECGITDNFITNDEPLEYTIRFQNTGNYFAQNVMITDTLSDKLDLGTFEIVGMSHPGNIIIDGRTLKIEFKDIMLPDSGANYQLSQGYVKFRIQPIDSFASGDIILNQASIIFDFNDPVITNFTSTSILQLPQIASIIENDGDCGLVVYPQCIFNTTLYSIDGQSFTYNNRFENLVPGPYHLWMIQQGDTIDLGTQLLDSCTMVSVIDSYTSSDGVFTIAPNPSSEAFTIYQSENKPYSFQIFNALGEMISFENNCNTPERKISTRSFESGIYFVKIKTTAEEKTFRLVKF